jgi:hypothetical protein
MKKHIKIHIHNENNTSIISSLITIIGANNSGNELFSINDVITVIKFKKIEYRYSLSDLNFELLDNKILLSTVVNKETVYFCTLEWVEIHELNVSPLPGDDFANSLTPKEREDINKFIDNHLELLDKEQQEQALRECKSILDESSNNRTLEGDGDE